MFYYLVEKVGVGTESDPFQPDYVGSFVWNPDAKCPHCETYLILLSEPTDSLKPITNLESACVARSLLIDDVLMWFVGGD